MSTKLLFYDQFYQTGSVAFICEVIKEINYFSPYLHVDTTQMHLLWNFVVAARRVQRSSSTNRNKITEDFLNIALKPLVDQQTETNQSLKTIQKQMLQLNAQRDQELGFLSHNRDFIIVFAVVFCQIVLQFLWK